MDHNELSSMCANVDQMCTKVLTTDITVMLLFLESTTGWQTTKIDTISGLHFGVLHGHTPYTRYLHLSFANGVALKFA